VPKEAIMSEGIMSAHRVLDYALTKAAVSSKLTTTNLRISHKELMASIGRSNGKDIDLVLTIGMAWDETNANESLGD
jgi:hypothetical protein